MQKYVTLYMFMLMCTSFSQTKDFDKTTDSLKQELKSAKSIIQKIDAAIGLGKIYNRTKADTALIYYRKAIALSEKENLIPYKAKSYSSVAAAFIITGKFDSAHYYFDKSEKLLDNITDYHIITAFYGDKGVLHYYEGEIAKAAESFNQALLIAKQEDDVKEIIRFSNNTALAYTQLGENEKAIDIYYETLKLAENHKENEQVGKLLNNIGLVYENMNQEEEALEYYKKAFEVKKEAGTQIDLANAYYNIGNMQLKLWEAKNDSIFHVEAARNFQKTYDLSKDNAYNSGMLYGLEGLGQIQLSLKKYENSKALYKTMDSLATAANNVPVVGVANLKLGVIAIEENDFQLARQKLFKAKDIIEKSGILKDKAQLYMYLSALYSKENDFKTANYYLKQQMKLDQELSSTYLQDKVSNYKIKHQTEKKEKEILSQRADLAENALDLNKKNSYITGLGGLIFIVALLGFLFYNQQKIKNRQFQKETELKDALLKIENQNRLQEQRLRISRDLHDNIGAQLTFIISSLDNLKYGFQLPDTLGKKLNIISDFTSATIYELRDTVWAMNQQDISLEDLQIRISNFIEKANKSSETVRFNFDSEPSTCEGLKFSSVVGMNIYRIIQEALNNALKYAEAQNINIKMACSNQQLEISISDDGEGFDQQIAHLGNGINNMKKRANELGAALLIDSDIAKGSTISLSIPLNVNANTFEILL